MYLRTSLCTVSFIALASGAFAAPATEAGAARLTQGFQTYFGTTAGVVTVTPDGDTYELQLDFAPLAALIPAENAKVTVTPLSYTLTDNGDGTWGVTEDQSFAMTIVAPGVTDATYNIENITSEGVWDEKLAAFTSQTATLTNFDATTISYDPEDGSEISRSVQKTEEITTTASGTAGAAGGVDMTVGYEATGLTQTATMPLDPSAPPMTLTFTADSYDGEMNAEAIKTHDILGLVGWFVANPSEAAIKSGQDEMRGLMTAALPFFKTLDGTFAMQALSVESPFGTFAAESASGTIDMNGIVTDGRFREGIELKGVTIPEGLVPEWAVGLVPSDLGLDITVSGFDLAAPAQLLLTSFDLNTEETLAPEVEGQLLPLFMPKGEVDITLAPGSAVSPIYTLTYEGSMKAGPGTMPTGSGRLTAVGLDKVQEELAKAPPEVSGQAMMPLAMAMGMAKTEGDTLVWDIDATQPGSLKINGTDLMAGMQ